MKTLKTYPRVIETSDEPTWALSAIASDDGVPRPHVINGRVEIRRYRITFERIEESIDVLRDRIRKLWRTSAPDLEDIAAMRKTAKQLGMDPKELTAATQGIDRERSLMGQWYALQPPRGVAP